MRAAAPETAMTSASSWETLPRRRLSVTRYCQWSPTASRGASIGGPSGAEAQPVRARAQASAQAVTRRGNGERMNLEIRRRRDSDIRLIR
jgi:hypothetical protein